MKKLVRKEVLAFLAVTSMAAGGPAYGAVGVDSTDLRAAVSADIIKKHLEWLEKNGTRTPATGYDAAIDEFASLLLDAGYTVTIQPFAYDFWELGEDSQLALITSEPTEEYFTLYEDFIPMEYSVAGTVTAEFAEPTDEDKFGCDPEDFEGEDFNDKIALIQRGECTFAQKAINAADSGAAGVVIYNDEERHDIFFGTLGAEVTDIPVVGTSYETGIAIKNTAETVFIDVQSTITYDIVTSNLIAETAAGRDDRVVVVGAHLDSVAAGPGINDNGSGAATILEIALQMAEEGIEPVNKVKFCWWGAEESGLLGSQYYVDSLSDRALKDIALNLNFDMIASPNYIRFVYDGDGSDTELEGPNGSANIEQVFANYFNAQGLPFEATAFDGRSDYGPFIDAGIPAGGLFTGADEIKTEEQVLVYGGTAGEPLDANYHTAADDTDNINENVLEEMADAAAHTVLTFAMTKSAVNGSDKGKGLHKWEKGMAYKGSKLKQ